MKCEVREATEQLSRASPHAESLEPLSFCHREATLRIRHPWVMRHDFSSGNGTLRAFMESAKGLAWEWCLSLPGLGSRAQPVLTDVICLIIGRGPTPS